MIERMLFGLLLLAAAVVLYATYNLTIVTGALIPEIELIREAVAVIEEAARQSQDAAAYHQEVLAEEACFERRGEWDPRYGCFLEEVAQ